MTHEHHVCDDLARWHCFTHAWSPRGRCFIAFRFLYGCHSPQAVSA